MYTIEVEIENKCKEDMPYVPIFILGSPTPSFDNTALSIRTKMFFESQKELPVEECIQEYIKISNNPIWIKFVQFEVVKKGSSGIVRDKIGFRVIQNGNLTFFNADKDPDVPLPKFNKLFKCTDQDSDQGVFVLDKNSIVTLDELYQGERIIIRLSSGSESELSTIPESIVFSGRSTTGQYDEIIKQCTEIFVNKNKDYGPSWLMLRNPSMLDQIFIKAKRIRTIQENKKQLVGDDIAGEYRAIVNYSAMMVFKSVFGDKETEFDEDFIEDHCSAYFRETRDLMLKKNHDYGEAWRDFQEETFIDLILVKLLRVKQILSNNGETVASEGVASNLYDIINYAVFALILLGEKHTSEKNISLA